MMSAVIFLCLSLLASAAAMALVRILKGPSILDRIIGFDLVSICIVGMMIVLSVWWQTHLFIEIMLIFSLLGFVGTVAFVSYLHNDPTKLRSRTDKKPKSPEQKTS